MSYFEKTKINDGDVLYTGTINTVGPGASINTQYYQSVSIQLANDTLNLGAVGILIEGSNDGNDWDTLRLYSTGELKMIDLISSQDDTFSLRTSTLYIRYNVLYISGNSQITIIGRSGPGPSSADNIVEAFDPSTPINVNLVSGVSIDANKAIILSDSIIYKFGPIVTGSTGVGGLTLDLSGYHSFNFQLIAGTITGFSQSIDGVNFYTTYVSGPASTVPSSSVTVASLYHGAVEGKYIRFTVGTLPCTFLIQLKQSQTPIPALTLNSGFGITNLSHINSTTAVTAGVAGMLAVGGNIAPGTAPTANPVLVGGVDANTLTRRILTSNTGSIIGSGQDYTNAPRVVRTDSQGIVQINNNSNIEGQFETEILLQILLELKIMNQQIYNLNLGANLDSPESYRADPTLFNINTSSTN